MKVLLYTENEKVIGKSGLGKAIKHQIKALELNSVPFTTNKNDDYDIDIVFAIIDDKILKVGMDTAKDLGIVLKEDNNEL